MRSRLLGDWQLQDYVPLEAQGDSRFFTAVPELRDITQEAKREFIKRTLTYAGPAGGQDATISHAISAIRQKKKRSLIQLLRASSGEG